MKIKICGITHPDDAEYAASLGADYIGMIFAGQSKRRVSLSIAKGIADRVRSSGTEPVGVFVEQTADQIISICQQTGITTVQLHGAVSQNALDILLSYYSIIYAIPIEEKGMGHQIQSLPSSVIPLYDNSKGGTGMPLNWKMCSPPKDAFWILAGGLNPNNVKEAIATLKPNGVDVATGVEFPNMTRKDPALVKAFIQNSRNSEEKI